eukprot:TRINITY_DN55943_c0_g1_i1.p1 TRINITY_DN55943_c0_g1~~TRINITY_DN55943_c0_g1_i1.p1  ORF type:complete len:1163 (+),score=189.71 TRINITY_DN55943_c0_g1_i1:98-3586(+)
MALAVESDVSPVEASTNDEVWLAVDNYVKAETQSEEVREKCLPTIVAALSARKVQLLDIVVHLERVLSDVGNPTGRRFAVRLLSDCLGHPGLAKMPLNFKHVETFANFFCSKFSDWQSVEGAVCGVLALLRRHGPTLRTLHDSSNGTNDQASEEPFVTGIARKLFKDVHTSSHTQQVRKIVLELVLLLISEWHEELSRLVGEQNLGVGVNAMVEEERDPRNLLLSFSIVRRLMERCNENCVPDSALTALFETLMSYFPINFTPPKDDKIGITGDDLRQAMVGALVASPRFAKDAVCFFLDSSTDISGADSAETIGQALEMLGDCFERYGPEITRGLLDKVLTTSRDQACRTTTPCTQKFATCVRRTLAVALRDTPVGLYPSWLSRKVDSTLASLTIDAVKDNAVTTLASKGSRQLLLGAAGAHPVLLEAVWVLVVPKILEADAVASGKDATSKGLSNASLPFVLDLVRMSDAPTDSSTAYPPPPALLAPRQMKQALAAALAALSSLSPPTTGGSRGSVPCKLPAAAFELVGRLTRQVGEDASFEAFRALRLALLPEADAASQTENAASMSTEAWAASWRKHFETVAADNDEIIALELAVRRTAGSQPARAREVAHAIGAATGHCTAPWMLELLPGLLATTVLSLSRRASSADNQDQEAASAACVLLEPAASLAIKFESPNQFAFLAALACALESSGVQADAARWTADWLFSRLDLPDGLLRLCEPLATGSGGQRQQDKMAEEVRSLVRALCSRLPAEQAKLLGEQIIERAVAACEKEQLIPIVALLPAVLHGIAAEAWPLCERILPTIVKCTTTDKTVICEPLALEALEALVYACPEGQMSALLAFLKSSFGDLLPDVTEVSPQRTPTIVAEPHAARGAARCWAAAAAALLRRGGFAQQAVDFLGALMGPLQVDGPVTPFVPLAFLVLMPPQFSSCISGGDTTIGTGDCAHTVDESRDAKSSSRKLPPLALQQLSRALLPQLLEHAKSSAKAAVATPSTARTGRAALECAAALLSSLPAEVAKADCKDELRWVAITGLQRALEDLAVATSASSASNAPILAVQVLQLLTRACNEAAAWIEDDMRSVVLPLTTLAVEHRVPLVRMGCLQVLQKIVRQSFGHMAAYKKQIESATRRASEDRRREVRLMAVACLNSWHCGSVADD